MKPLHWSQLREMDTSPADFLYRQEHPRASTRPMKIGNLAHEFVLGVGPYSTPWVVYDGERKGNKWKEFKAEHSGLVEIFTKSEKDQAMAISRVVLDAWPEYLKGGELEKTIQWEINGRVCEGTPDSASDVALVDLKVTAYANPRRFPRHCRSFLYHAQLAWYHDGLVKNGIHPAAVYVFAVEPTPPHGWCLYELTDDTINVGRKVYTRLLDKLDECESNGHFPSYNNGEVVELNIESDEPVTLVIDGEEVAL